MIVIVVMIVIMIIIVMIFVLEKPALFPTFAIANVKQAF
jgi:hypothetical protein